MAETTDKQTRDWTANILADVVAPFGITKLYSDYQVLKEMDKLAKNIGILHKAPSILTETKGTGVAEYETLYTIIVITQAGKDNVSFNADRNEERLDQLITAVGTQLISAGQDQSCPYSKPPIIQEYGIGNREDPIGLSGTDEQNWANLIVLYCTVSIFHRRIF